MNNIPNVLKVAKQAKHRSTFPLSFSHMTTMDFGKTTILHSMELMANDEIDINLSAMCQMAPMVVPTMGSFDLNIRAFFVPFRFAWEHWEEFVSNLKFSRNGDAMPDTVPLLTLDTIATNFFDAQNACVEDVTSGTEEEFADFIVRGDTEDDDKYYNATPKGRLWLQILLGLGYPMPIIDTSSDNENFSSLPLLCLCKIFRDYYVNPNYNYSTIDGILHRASNAGGLTDSEFVDMMEFVSWAWFENDIFTSAWTNPESPEYSEIYSHSVYTGSSIPATLSSGFRQESVYESELNNVTTLRSLDSNNDINTINGITQYGLNLLKAVRNFVLRRSVSGARYIDQMLSRFGIRLDENEARRSHFIKSCVLNPNITRVDATSAGFDAAGATSALGDFSGRGTMSIGNEHFHFKNEYNDFGQLIFIAHLMPRTNYYQGVKPHVNHLTFNDFFNGDLEDVGNAPIPNNVVFDDFRDTDVRGDNANSIKGVFGYAPNYYEYKTQFDYLTGDFRLQSQNAQIKSFQTMRELLPFNASNVDGIPAVLGEYFQKCHAKGVEPYDRIFLTQGNYADHFIINFGFDVSITRDCNSLGNSLLAELNEHGNDVGELVKVRPNGKYF